MEVDEEVVRLGGPVRLEAMVARRGIRLEARDGEVGGGETSPEQRRRGGGLLERNREGEGDRGCPEVAVKVQARGLVDGSGASRIESSLFCFFISERCALLCLSWTNQRLELDVHGSCVSS